MFQIISLKWLVHNISIQISHIFGMREKNLFEKSIISQETSERKSNRQQEQKSP